MNQPLADALESDGFALVRDAIEPALLSSLTAAISAFAGCGRDRGIYRRPDLYAIRNLFELVPETKSVLEAKTVREVVSEVLGPGAFCVRALFLDKTPRTNWKVPWHQDATIVVKRRAEVTGFGPWTMKAGLQHVMAPPGTLSAMLTLRLHLDDCDESRGALRVIRASHQYGRLPEDSIEQFTRYGVETCVAPRGSLLAMRPLLLHSSKEATAEGSRRVIQLDLCARRLPLPLEWREAHPIAS
jgi:ectoine hydroxylase-related dioxygenase (phytanoyl-CoA dioxygenase family)